MSTDDEVLSQAEQPDVKLIVDADYAATLTLTREIDPRGAALRGLAEYIGQFSMKWFDGKEIRPLNVFPSAADFEEQAAYPAIVLSTPEDVIYDSPEFVGRMREIEEGSGIYYRIPAELQLKISVDIYCTTKTERAALISLMEDILEPVDWMAGARLELPFYHNAVCTYLKTSLQVLDPPDNTGRRMRLASISVSAELPQIRLIGTVPGLDPRIEVEVTEGGV